jgi:hypothetical protein
MVHAADPSAGPDSELNSSVEGYHCEAKFCSSVRQSGVTTSTARTLVKTTRDTRGLLTGIGGKLKSKGVSCKGKDGPEPEARSWLNDPVFSAESGPSPPPNQRR